MKLLAAVLSLLWGCQAAAQLYCAPRETVTDRLTTKYGKHFAGGGLQSAETIFEVWIDHDKGTWTILMTRSDGTSCIIASGTSWREGVKVPPGVPG